MKKRIGYIFVLALLTSCSSDLPIDTTEPHIQPQGAEGFISFGASSVAVLLMSTLNTCKQQVSEYMPIPQNGSS